jgi:hypothetical protein
VAEHLPVRQQVEEHAPATRDEDRQPCDAGEDDVEVPRLAARMVDDLIAAILADDEAALERVALVRTQAVERGHATERAITGERRHEVAPGFLARRRRCAQTATH